MGMLLDELKNINEAVKPNEILLVIDSMTGQDAINVINDDFTTYMEKSVRNAIELFAILDEKEGVC